MSLRRGLIRTEPGVRQPFCVVSSTRDATQFSRIPVLLFSVFFLWSILCDYMVLVGTTVGAKGFYAGAGFKGANISTLSSLYFNLCEACQTRTMASIPPSAFSAGRIRETQRNSDMKLSNTGTSRNESKFFETSLLELSPLKYNSKLMNSIWGFYNRYSPHNVKKINDAFSFNVELPQAAGNSTHKN